MQSRNARKGTYMKKLTLLIAAIFLSASLMGCAITPQTLEEISNDHPVTSLTKTTRYTPTDANGDIIEQHPDYVISQGRADIEDNLSQDMTYKNFSSEELANGAIHYESLDVLGRTQAVAGVITYKMREEGTEREREDMPNPAGWKSDGKSNNNKVTIDLLNGKTYKGYFYNRSHLIAKSLGGVETAENLITGTRTQNVGKNDGNGGMAYAEEKARNYLDSHQASVVYYKATPAYVDNELLPRSVFVDIKTTDGELDEHVEVLNACYGFTIDYKTGKFETK